MEDHGSVHNTGDWRTCGLDVINDALQVLLVSDVPAKSNMISYAPIGKDLTTYSA